jgi:uncharacterized membrane protein (DUF485 family)
MLRAFHFFIRHVPGELNVCADLLSRWAAPQHAEIARVAKTRRRKRRTNPINPTFVPDIAIQFNVQDAPTEAALLDAQLRDPNLQDQAFLAKHQLRKRTLMATGSTRMMLCMFRILIIFAFASALLRTRVQPDTVAPLSRTTGFANISGGLACSVMSTSSLAHATSVC